MTSYNTCVICISLQIALPLICIYIAREAYRIAQYMLRHIKSIGTLLITLILVPLIALVAPWRENEGRERERERERENRPMV